MLWINQQDLKKEQRDLEGCLLHGVHKINVQEKRESKSKLF
jgi:hypothetical protein